MTDKNKETTNGMQGEKKAPEPKAKPKKKKKAMSPMKGGDMAHHPSGWF